MARNYGRPLTEGEVFLRGEAAALIRKHFWIGNDGQIEMPESPDRRPWTMARELNIWTILVVQGRVDPGALNGAIEVVRRLRPEIDGPMRMTYFYHHGSGRGPGGTALLEQAIAYWHVHDTREQMRQGKLPPTIAATLRRMVT